MSDAAAAKSPRPRPKLQGMSVVLTVADVGRSLAFYRDRLGFDVLWQDGEPATYAIAFRDAVALHLQPADLGPEAQASRGRASIYVFAGDVDALFVELKSAGCAVESAPRSFSHGMREMSVRDLDGNRLTFAQDAPRSP